MSFRADEAARDAFEEAKNYLIPRDLEADERKRSEKKLLEIADEYGPVIDSYPSWHPLVVNHDGRNPETIPSRECGYRGLDHTRFFLNAFITCPYTDGQEVIDAVEKLPGHSAASITAERLDVKFYSSSATPILVSCDWNKLLDENQMIPASLAVPLMLEQELPCWHWAQRAETWETMRRYFLGSPHGSRSSLFVSQETALGIKKVWELLIDTGMFGPRRAA